jgi:hypothetical protein
MNLVPDVNFDPRWLPAGEVERREREAEERRAARYATNFSCRILCVDWALRRDFTAIVGLDCVKGAVNALNIERYRHRDYADLADRVKDIMSVPAMTGAYLVVDRSGVGEAAVSLLKERQLEAYGITITAGKSYNVVDKHTLNVSKQEIVYALVSLFNRRKISVNTLSPEGAQARRELENFCMKATENNGITYENAKDSIHDDIASAIMLGAWMYGYLIKRQPRPARQFSPFS